MNQTAICNLALLRIGIGQNIVDISDNTAPARACLAVYAQCLETMLRERPWGFSTRQVDLALVGEQLMSGWLFSYRYPTGFMTVNRVIPAESSVADPVVYTTTTRTNLPDTHPFKIGSDASGRLIHSNVPDATAIGTFYVDDTAQFDPLFSSALAWFIAAEIALSLTKNRELYGNALSEYRTVVSEAFAMSENEAKPQEQRDADMIEARE